MKRLVLTLVSALLLVSCAGCAKESAKPPVHDTESSPMATNSPEGNKTESMVGKVSDLVGNEVTVKLLADDFALTDEMKELLGIVDLTQEELDRLEQGGTVELPNGMMGSTTQGGDGTFDWGADGTGGEGEAIPVPDQGEDGSADQDPGYDYEAEQKAKRDAVFNKMEFSGESRDFVIKAGTVMMNALTGEEATLSDLKKGSIITLELDEKGNVTRVVMEY